MPYRTETFAYTRPNAEETPGVLRKAFTQVLAQLPSRIRNISDYLYDSHRIRISIESSDEVLDQMGGLIAALGRMQSIPEEVIEKSLASVHPKKVEMVRALAPRQMLDGETLAMVFDGALLIGEAFRFCYPAAQWAIGKRPKSSIDYGDPVLVGVDKFQDEFGVRTFMMGSVGCKLLNLQDELPVSRMFPMRAFSLGLGPDPRPEGMSDYEKKVRGPL